ncbi:phage holin family protein [Serratia entomophila]|uniref:phage holin family protein n=1 Tax=Serratia entomophila TaxID=42906 RepID=UPI0021B70383|nr:phage holin family protein [Serratia entomophila]
MTEPVGTGAATATLTGVTVAGLLSGVDSGVLIGAFAGAVIFVMSASEFSLLKKLALFVASLLVGILAAPFTAAIITWATPGDIEAHAPVGALVASAIAVRLLMSASQNPTGFFDRFRRGGGDAK